VLQLRWLSLFVVATLPSCLVYDQALIDGAEGTPADIGSASGASGGTGGGDSSGGRGGDFTGGSGASSTGGSGATNSGGGGLNIGTGGVSAGGTGATGATGGMATGGTAPAGGTGGGSGDPCDTETPEFTGVSSVYLIDSFDTDATPYSDTVPQLASEVTGFWGIAADSGGTYQPISEFLSWKETGGYEERGCTAQGNLAFHATASNAEWMSLDAQMMFKRTDSADLSDYDGIIFHAKSSESILLSVRFESPGGGGDEFFFKTIGSTWKQYVVPFSRSTGFVKSNAKLIKLVPKRSGASAPIDFWVENLSLYKE